VALAVGTQARLHLDAKKVRPEVLVPTAERRKLLSGEKTKRPVRLCAMPVVFTSKPTTVSVLLISNLPPLQQQEQQVEGRHLLAISRTTKD
jgi:hypothetical protein